MSFWSTDRLAQPQNVITVNWILRGEKWVHPKRNLEWLSWQVWRWSMTGKRFFWVDENALLDTHNTDMLCLPDSWESSVERGSNLEKVFQVLELINCMLYSILLILLQQLLLFCIIFHDIACDLQDCWTWLIYVIVASKFAGSWYINNRGPTISRVTNQQNPIDIMTWKCDGTLSTAAVCVYLSGVERQIIRQRNTVCLCVRIYSIHIV